MSCSCNDCNDITILPGTPGTDGADGANGSDGKYGGHSSIWKFQADYTGSAAPTNYLKVNSATYSVVTSIRVNESNADSTDMSGFLTSFDATGNYGYIRLFKEYDDNTFWIGKITNVVDNGSDRTLTVTHTQSNNTFSADDNVVLTFTPIAPSQYTSEIQKLVDSTQTIVSVTDALGPAAYANLYWENTAGTSRNYKITVDFNAGDETAAAANNTTIAVSVWTGASAAGVGGSKIHECLQVAKNDFDADRFVLGQSFNLLHSPATGGPTVTLAAGEFLDVRFRTPTPIAVGSAILNYAILTVKELS